MPAKVWDTQSDWEGWDLTNLSAEDTPGKLVIASGYTSGTGISPVFEASNWQAWAALQAIAEVPQGCAVWIRWRTGDSAGACEAADWSPYKDDWTVDGYLTLDLGLWFMNNEITPGAFVQFGVYMRGE